MREVFREPFDPGKTFVVCRPVRLGGRPLAVGAVFPRDRVELRRLRQLYDSRMLGYPGETGRQRVRPTSPVRVRLGAGSAAAMPVPPVPIPDGWRDLEWIPMQVLARKFTKATAPTREECIEAIETEIMRRERRREPA
jgi:hypothetical protein